MTLSAHSAVRSRLRTAIVGTTAALLISLLSSCADDAGSPGSEGGTTTLTMAGFPNGNTLDPWGSQVSPYAQHAMYDTLTRIGPDGDVVPWLAESWEYTDATTLELSLREGVTFDDGTPFDAEAVKANLEYGQAANPKNLGSAPYLAAIGDIEVVDPQTVRITLSTPNPDLPFGFSQQAGWMVSPEALQDPDSLTFGGSGTGPYTLDAENSVAQDTYTFVAKDDYWAADEVDTFDTLVLKIIPDPTAQANAARSGTVDFFVNPLQDEVPDMTSTEGSANSIAGLYIQDVAGTLVPQLADVRVRQAMNYAIDREAILDTVLGGAGELSNSSPFTENSTGWSDELATYYTYDPERARQLLAEAGYADGFTIPTLVNGQFSALAQAIAGNLAEVGITLDLTVAAQDITEQTVSGNWPLVSVLTGVNSRPYSDVQNLMTPASLYNPLGNSDPQIEALLTEAASATDENARAEAFGRLGEYTASQAWMVTPALSATTYTFDPDVVELETPPGSQVDLYMITPAS